MKALPLNSTVSIPVLGFGTWQLSGTTCEQAVETALEVGYRHIDTADRYGNHQQVARAIKKSGVNRSNLFLTTKVWHSDLDTKDVISAGERFLEELETEYIDLLLVHWPNRHIPMQKTFAGFQHLLDNKYIRAIGVSNFTRHHLEDALQTGITITNNQVEFHPSLNQQELKKFCDQHSIVLTAYSPLAQGQDLKLPVVQELARKYQRSSSQIVLNWLISKNIVAIPRSSNPERILDNFKTTEWNLEKKDVGILDKQNTNNRLLNLNFSEFNY